MLLGPTALPVVPATSRPRTASTGAFQLSAALRDRGIEGENGLLTLLRHERLEVRGWAAAHALDFASDRALPVLEEIAAGPASLEEFTAKNVLQQWRNGTLRRP